MQNIEKQLRSIVDDENIKLNEPLKNYTYTRLGGNADFLVTPKTSSEIQQIIQLVKKENIPFTLLGNGSNVIIKDGGIRGIVLLLKNVQTMKVENDVLIAGAGASIIHVAEKALEKELTGLEFACGIPGTVGGAVYMNAGAYGGEIEDVLKEVKVIDRDGHLLTKRAADLQLGYRTSNIGMEEHIVVEATFQLRQGNYSDMKEQMDDLTCKREEKQPLEYPSCGSVFKRPPGYFAGKLIQDSKLQGVQIGGAEVSTKHAGFIVNKNKATAAEYIALIEHVQRTVLENSSIQLEREVRIIGEDMSGM